MLVDQSNILTEHNVDWESFATLVLINCAMQCRYVHILLHVKTLCVVGSTDLEHRQFFPSRQLALQPDV